MMIVYLMFVSGVSISTGLNAGHYDYEFWESARWSIWGMPHTFLEERLLVPSDEEKTNSRDGRIRLVKRKDYFPQLRQM